MNRTNKAGIICVIILLILLVLGGGSSSSSKCAWCNGTGWVGNGAKNEIEYAFKKTTCPYCHGTGKYK